MKERAYGKINLCLDVTGIKEDGYHDLRMVMAPIDFYDMLEMVPAEETTMTLNRSYLPVNDKNTVIKAIRVMKEHYGFDMNFACTLEKHIPTQAGLAGGSADAAAAIRIINRMLNLNMSQDDMIACGREVGSDVPFCLIHKPALVEGTGEKIYPFECHPDFGLLLVKPRKGVSTKLAFGGLDAAHMTHPDVDGMRQALIDNDYERITECLGNTLEEVSMNLVPDIREIKEDLLDQGFDGVLMSGSGSTVFGITKNPALLRRSADLMRYKRYFVRITRILTDAI